MRLRVRNLALLLGVGWLLASGCGDDRSEPAARPTTTPGGTVDRSSPVPAGEPAASCGDVPVPPLHGSPADSVEARVQLDRAARRATRAGHRMRIELDVAGALGSRTASLEGRRLPTGESAARLDWTVLGFDLRIVDDRLYRRRPLTDWRDLGSASGAALDVGRELLDHAFLLDAVAARRDGRRLAVTLEAPAAQLRAYATTERRGPVTDLLTGTRMLRITSIVDRGRLAGDRFVLVATPPPSLRPLLGRAPVTIRGRSTYCPLRLVDRSPITAPAAR